MRKLCFRLRLSEIERPTAAYIHPRGRGSKRRVKLFRRPGGISHSTTKGCVKTRTEKLLGRIANRPRKFYVDLDGPDPSNRAIGGRLGRVKGDFETGNFRDFDYWSVSHGSLSVTRRRAYEGRRAARATNRAVGNQYQRVWYDVDWREGSSAWYGMALYIPRLSDWCWWNPIRWDNHQSFGSAGDVGGLRVWRNELYLDVGRYREDPTTLIGPVAIPQGRWFWVEVHQRLSPSAGRALSELYLDGVKVGSSTAANSAGRPIDEIRYGNVAMESSCSAASSIFFDRVSLSAAQRAPLPGRRP
jgi:Polysaccharide lyase